MTAYEILGDAMIFGDDRPKSEDEKIAAEDPHAAAAAKTKAVTDIFTALAQAAGEVGTAALGKPQQQAIVPVSKPSAASGVPTMMWVAGGLIVLGLGAFLVMRR